MNDKVEVKEVQTFTIGKVTIKRSDLANMDRDTADEYLHGKGLKLSERAKVWSNLGTKNKGGVFGAFLKFCEEKPQTASALADFLMSDKSSGNEVRWFNQRDSIRKLSVAVFVKLGAEFKEKPTTLVQDQAMAAIVKKIDDANKAKKAAKAS